MAIALGVGLGTASSGVGLASSRTNSGPAGVAAAD
ncbi:MAG: hypothetical protein QOD99_100, partial [Chthoniobacter sp.]|nr:hypothetical protein [Chthoniobacter sp.]